MTGIHYSELLKLLEASDHNGGSTIKSLLYLKCNRTKRTGGDWVVLEDVQKCGLPYHCADNEMRGFKAKTGKIDAVHLRLVFEINGQPVYP